MNETTEQVRAGRTIAIGDIHGHSDALRRLIDRIQPQREDTIIPHGKKLWKANDISVEGGVQRSKNGEWYLVARSILKHDLSLVNYSSSGQLVGQCQLPGFEQFCWLDQSRCAFLGIVEEELRKFQPYLTIIDASKW